MKSYRALLTFAVAALVGCATHTQFKVTLSQTVEVYSGTLTFDGPYTGELTIPKGPGEESFTGRYVNTDMTPISISAGVSASGQLDAKGVWTGRGSRGSTIVAEVKVGRGGHGIGTAKDSNGKEYQISF